MLIHVSFLDMYTVSYVKFCRLHGKFITTSDMMPCWCALDFSEFVSKRFLFDDRCCRWAMSCGELSTPLELLLIWNFAHPISLDLRKFSRWSTGVCLRYFMHGLMCQCVNELNHCFAGKNCVLIYQLEPKVICGLWCSRAVNMVSLSILCIEKCNVWIVLFCLLCKILKIM